MLNYIVAFFKLIRWKNLAIIAFTQFVVHYFLIRGMISVHMGLGMSLQLNRLDFFLLVFSTILISAAGYIINDYFDTRIDYVNKPGKVVIGRGISRRHAMFIHTVFNISGVLLGFYLAYKIGQFNLGMIHLLSTGLLWFYSTDFKKRAVTGNLVISFLTFLVPMVVVLYDAPVLKLRYQEVLEASQTDLMFLLKFVTAFSGFAFLTTFIRELVKDLEDMEGDREFGCRTLPVTHGVVFTKALIVAVSLLCMGLLSYVMYVQYLSRDWYSFYYFLCSFQFLFVYFIWKIRKADNAVHYHLASRTIKVLMLLGVAYCILFYYLLNKG